MHHVLSYLQVVNNQRRRSRVVLDDPSRVGTLANGQQSVELHEVRLYQLTLVEEERLVALLPLAPHLPHNVAAGDGEVGQLTPHTLRVVDQRDADAVYGDLHLLLDALRLAGGAGQPVRQVDIVREEKYSLHPVQKGDPGEDHAADGEGAVAVRLESVFNGWSVNACVMCKQII